MYRLSCAPFKLYLDELSMMSPLRHALLIY
jgi:hypothetical protein